MAEGVESVPLRRLWGICLVPFLHVYHSGSLIWSFRMIWDGQQQVHFIRQYDECSSTDKYMVIELLAECTSIVLLYGPVER